MRGRYQIVLSTRTTSGSSGDSPAIPESRYGRLWLRFKTLILGSMVLLIGAIIMVTALVFGSMLGVVLWTCLVLVIAVTFAKVIWRRIKGQ